MLAEVPELSGWKLIRRIHRLRRNYAREYVAVQRELGDVVRVRFRERMTMFFRPEAARYILKDNAKNYAKSRLYELLHPLLGLGMVTSEGESWRASRRRVAPEFHLPQIEPLLPMIDEEAARLMGSFRASRSPQRDVAADFMELTFRVAGRAFFGMDVSRDSRQAYESLQVAAQIINARVMALVQVPPWVPTPRAIRERWAIQRLDEIVYRIIDDPRAAEAKGNVLARLMAGGSAGERMSRKELRDEVMTLLMAGHETTSNALAWTSGLLARNPEVQARAREESARALASGAVSIEALSRLTYLKQVLQESMRLYPPVPIIGRAPIEADSIEGIAVAPGDIVEICPYVTHRHPAYWKDPERFDPDRFAPERASEIVPFAYLPFGGGPRSCIGEAFAMNEALLVLARLLSGFELQADGPMPDGQPTITLKPRGGMRIRVRPIG